MYLKEIIRNSAKSLFQKFQAADWKSLPISDYTKRYLGEYLNNYNFYICYYQKVLREAFQGKENYWKEQIFCDYGGGSGMMSFLALEMGCKQVIYSDIFEDSTKNVSILGEAIGLIPHHIVCGDIDELADYVKQKDIHIDIMASFDVLEHIYSIEKWFKKAGELSAPLKLVFCTSANGDNPFVRKRLAALQISDELHGAKEKWGWKERDAVESFYSIRKKIIEKNFPKLQRADIEVFAKNTRGLMEPDILETIKKFILTENWTYYPTHPTNTCDPFTGSWTEHLIPQKELKQAVENAGFLYSVQGTYYSRSKNRIKRIFQFLMNLFIWLTRRKSLFFTPNYILTAKKTYQ